MQALETEGEKQQLEVQEAQVKLETAQVKLEQEQTKLEGMKLDNDLKVKTSKEDIRALMDEMLFEGLEGAEAAGGTA